MRRTATNTQRLWRGMRSWQRSTLAVIAVLGALIQLGGSSAAVNDPPDIVGQWSAPFSWPIVAVHMSLTSTGEVFALDGFGPALNSEHVWNPSTSLFRSVPYGRNLFCSGHIQLPDGRTLLVGGHINAYEGLADTTLFNAQTDSYFRAPDMEEPRWYPTATQLPDGRVLVFAGDRIVQDRPGALPPFSDASVNSLPEIYNPTTNTWTSLPSGELTSPLYPMLFVLSDGRIVNVGPDTTTRVLTPGTWTWSTITTSPFDGHSAVMYRPNKIMKSGTWADPDFQGPLAYDTNGRTAVLDMSSPTPTWRETSPMAHGRAYHNMTLLPDGTVLASGGSSRSDGVDLTKSVLPAEIWNPDTETWTTVDSLENGRQYHSTALLLPDGRVLMAGGGAVGGATDVKNGEIYSPPYLFKGARPTITTAPGTMSYGTSFNVTTPNAAQIAKVSLIRSPSVTHAFDMNQRFQFLDFTVSGGTLTVQAPENSNLAPPGDYLLFLVDTNGVPSVASFIRQAPAPASGDTTPPTVSITAPAGGATLAGTTSVSANAADNDAVGGVQFKLDGADLGTEDTTAPYSVSWDTETAANGPHTLTAVARDLTGNTATATAVPVTVSNSGPPPGLVAAYGFDAGTGTAVTDASANGNNGTLTNATWAGATAGRFGNALSFNGTSASVSIPDSASLDLTAGMTLEAWVRPTTLGNAYRTIVLKEQPGYYAYGLYAATDNGRPSGNGMVAGVDREVRGTAALPLNTWTHVATTYDGGVLALYVDGVQTATLLASGSIATSTNPLKIGGNAIWGEWFSGLIDEVRIYNRALTATEIQGDMSRPVTNPDSVAPSAPGVLSVSGGLSSASLSWGAASDDVGVVRYNVHRSTTAGFTPALANRVAQPTGTSYTDAVAAGTYYYRVTAEDAAGNVGPASNEGSATVGDTQAPSAPGTLSAVGSVGKATLSWGAATDNVGVLRYNVHRSTSSGFTPSLANRVAQPTTTGYVDTTVPGSYFYRVTAEDAAGNIGAASNQAAATVTADTTAPSPPSGLTAPVTGSTANLAWTAATDDVGVVRYNVHRGTTSGFTPAAGNRIAQPSGTSYADTGLATGSYFYKVTAEDAAGNTSAASNEATATVADATPPSAPGTLTASATGSTVNLAWTAATDNVGVARYNLHRGSTSGFTPTTANRIAQPTGTSYADSGLAPGTYYYKLSAEDAAGNIGPLTNTANATVADTTPPSTPTLTATGGAGQTALTWTAATDNVAVSRYNLHRSTTSGFTPTTTNRIAQPTGLSYTDTGLSAGTYYYKLTAEDAAGNQSTPSNQATATVTAPPVTGLVAAYGLDTGTGTTITDQSGTGNNGTTSNTTWTTNGKYGNALTFNGTNASATIPDANSLDLTTGMTLQAWVRPTALGSNWRTAVLKESTGSMSYGLYAHGGDTGTMAPTGEFVSGGYRIAQGTTSLALNTWTHIATTYDGTTLRLFVNGAQAAQLAYSGAITTSTGSLRIGGNGVWGEWFQGDIDEIRIYNRALTATEIQADMNTSISAPDTSPPSAPGTLTATGGLGQISLAWGAATDNVVVSRYNVHRGTSAGFTPAAGNRIAQPTGTSYADTGLAPGTYYYKVTAEDVAGNVGPAGNEASAAAAADTTPPTVSITAPSAGATVSATVSVNATASDNGTVTGVQFKLDGANLGAEDTAAPYSISWDTFAAANGAHTLTAVARDSAGNTTTSPGVAITVSNTGSVGLVGAWAFDEGSGTTTADQSGRGNTGTLSNAAWVTNGKFNNALSFNGTNAWVTVADAATLDLTTGMTLEAWVRPAVAGGWRTVVAKEQPGGLAYGLYSNTNGSFPGTEATIGGAARALNGTGPLPAGSWSHVAATYDGTMLRLLVNGVQVSQLLATGSIATSASPLRIGGNGAWGEWFNGTIDEVRVYNRALGAAEIQGDMVRSITPDTVAPTIVARTPTPGSAGINAGTSATVRFNELMNSGSITSSTFQLRDSGNGLVSADVTYDGATSTATLTPQDALAYGGTYTVTVKGGAGGVADLAGNPIAADSSWTFSVEASPPPILVVGSTGNPFGSYLGELLRNEGLNAFTTIDVAFVSPGLLAQFDVVVMGDTPLSPAQVTSLTGWVQGGGNLIAMRPDKQLAGFLGLADAGTTLANAYLQVATGSAPGAGIVGSTMQFHGTADRYTLNGATSVATLYTTATTPTSNPAVTLRSVGTSGGQAAAFTYDLARSVVYARQGNPAWASQERDGVPGIRPDDLFYGARAGDVQPDWVDTNKIAIPQADEQQRLLLNLITEMERDKLPMPRFWYLPRGEKAVVVMSGDDHSPVQATGGTASHFDRYKALSPAGCIVADWECVRSTSYIYPNSTLTSAQANSYVADGFEVALHPLVTSCPTTAMTAAELATYYDTQLASWQAKYTSVPAPASSRTHCVYWPDWVSNATVELGRGIRMDANYYHFPGPWIGAKPGFMNGGGFPMRFADTDGTPIDVYQQNTNMTDESTTSYQTTIDALLDNAVGAPGYYGAFGANMHTDTAAPHSGAEAIVASALARSVPVVSYRQLLTWVDGRNSSTIRGLSWSAGTLTFVTTVGAGANGLQTMLPVQGPSGTLTGITRGGTPVSYTTQTVKGIQYAFFAATNATYQATYS